MPDVKAAIHRVPNVPLVDAVLTVSALPDAVRAAAADSVDAFKVIILIINSRRRQLWPLL